MAQLSRREDVVVNNTSGEYLLAFDIQPDGTVKNRRNFASYDGAMRPRTASPAAPTARARQPGTRLRRGVNRRPGVQSAGQILGTIPALRAPQNRAFAGAGKKTLCRRRGALYKVAMIAEGLQRPREVGCAAASFELPRGVILLIVEVEKRVGPARRNTSANDAGECCRILASGRLRQASAADTAPRRRREKDRPATGRRVRVWRPPACGRSGVVLGAVARRPLAPPGMRPRTLRRPLRREPAAARLRNPSRTHRV